ncbi:hypothetical protein [Kitasatospora sp. MAP5-34]|uniref:hypothetical protein n=1 Tax=Kitasatospora sp. MAP5-34 TaxID=3035102 RepID=UPI0024749609|nr:hypothetical protein [Kitasatospora sp. MAP5-34]
MTMITKVTGQTVIALPSCAPALFGSTGISSDTSSLGVAVDTALLRGVVVLAGNGLGLDATGVSAVTTVAALTSVSGLGNTDAGSVEAGLSNDWATFDGGRELRSERPIQASKAAVAAAKHGDYARVIGAGEAKKQDEQQINKAEAAFMGAMAVRIRAYRGPQPWRERT